MGGEVLGLGIDFGTSFTVVSEALGGSESRVVTVDGLDRAPSVVWIDDGGDVVAGRAAEREVLDRPERGLRSVKSRLGQADRVVLAGRVFDAAELVAAILAHSCAASSGSQPAAIVLTHPADWGQRQLDHLGRAAQLAGIDTPMLRSEPVAAAHALAADDRPRDGGILLVYDLGGGTLDTAVVQVAGADFATIGRPGGDRGLGGDLFDQVLLNHIGETQLDPEMWHQCWSSDDEAWLRATGRLRAQVRWAKELLSIQPLVEFPAVLPSGTRVVALERRAADILLEPLIVDSVAVAHRTLADAGVTVSDLHGVLLVGGASRLPLVAASLHDAFPGIRLLRPEDPKAAVAHGAARLANATNPARSTRPQSQHAAPATRALAGRPASPAPLDGEARTPPPGSRRARRSVARAAGAALLVAGVTAAVLWRLDDTGASQAAAGSRETATDTSVESTTTVSTSSTSSTSSTTRPTSTLAPTTVATASTSAPTAPDTTATSSAAAVPSSTPVTANAVATAPRSATTGSTAATTPPTAASAPLAMPAILGLSEAQGRAAVEALGLIPSVVPHRDANTGTPCGTVSGQAPGVGVEVSVGQRVSIYVANHAVCRGEQPAPATVAVPFVLSIHVDQAVAQLQALGLSPSVSRRTDLFAGLECNIVGSQSPADGTVVAVGTTIEIGIVDRADCP